MPRITSTASNMIKAVSHNMTSAQMLEHESLDKRVSRMWRNFWIRAAAAQGYSNAEIARAFEISEGTVRYALKGH